MRKRQDVKIVNLRVTPVAPDLAHSTSEDKLEMLLSDDSPYNAKHVYTLIWKKESTGWKIPYLTNPG